MAKPIRLVILNDDQEAVERLTASLSGDGMVVYSTADPDEACHLISLLQHDILLIDVEVLISTPVYPLQNFREAKPDLKILGISRRGQLKDSGLLRELLSLDAYVREPVTPEKLITALPEIANRYLMVKSGGASNSQHEDDPHSKWPLKLIPSL